MKNDKNEEYIHLNAANFKNHIKKKMTKNNKKRKINIKIYLILMMSFHFQKN